MTDENILRVVNTDGEVELLFNRDKQYIRDKKQDMFFQKKMKADEDWELYREENGKFIWSYPDKIQFLIHSKEFTKADMTMIFYLATYVNGTGYLAFNNAVKLDKSGLQTVLDLGRNAFGKFYNKLVKYEILIPTGKAFKWSEAYNFYGSTKGKAKPKVLVRTFVNQIREMYEAKNEIGKRRYSAIKLYPIFALVPYLHHSSNIVCKNPDVKDIEDIEYFTLSEVAELLDLTDSKKMTASLSSLLLDGQTTFIKIESKNEKYLKLNPRIFWRGTKAPDKNMVTEFDMIDNNRSKRKKNQKALK